MNLLSLFKKTKEIDDAFKYLPNDFVEDKARTYNLDNPDDFIRAIIGDFTFKIEMISNKRENYEIISKNFKSNFYRIQQYA